MVVQREKVHTSWAGCAAALLGVLLLAGAAPAPPGPTTAPAGAMVSLNLPDNAPLKVLIDYVTQEFGVNILYDEQISNQRLTIKAPAQLPKSAVPALLESALKMKGMALVDADQPGWKRVVPLAQAAVPRPATGPAVAEDVAAVTQVFKLQFTDAKALDAQLKPFLTQTGASSFPLPEQGLIVVTDFASNVKRVGELIRSIDQPGQDVGMEFFPVKHGDPARITLQVDQLLKAKLRTQGGGERLIATVEATYDARTNQIVVIAPKEQLKDAREVVRALDTAVAAEQSPVRFYKLANTTAGEVLATIRGLEDEQETPGAGGSTRNPRDRSDRAAPAGDAPATPAAAPSMLRPRDPGAAPTEAGQGAAGAGAAPAALPPRSPGTSAGAGGVAPASPALREAIRTKQARITADPHTNSIIVIAPPDVQRVYEQLIRTLDKRRPQVLIECTIVTLDTSNNAELGVEIGRSGGFDDSQLITFSSFGLSVPDPKTGRLSLIPGLGFNGALISSDIADVIVRAISKSSRARVTSSPRILVNDNNVGTLSSIAEFPYSSVNASNTIATTSFGDYVQAGTEITVTPHISESDYLQLEYSVSLSSFTGQAVQQGDTVLPPPRKSDSVQSQVTIPDGATIVVGGLNRRNFNRTIDAVPFLGRLPILGALFSNRTSSDSNTTLFVFIRPVILRDDKFEDLKFLSEKDAREAGVPADFPRSEPLTIR